MLHVTFSNRSEALLDALVDDLAAIPAAASPFTPEHLIVPGAAQRRAVTLALADRQGICANVEFSYLAQWLWQRMAHFIGIRDASPFAAPVLEWRLRELFDDAGCVARLGVLRPYLEAADPLLRYEMARQVATLFETYVTYRPGWLARWSAGERVPELAAPEAGLPDHEAWQAALWTRIAGDIGIDRQHPSVAFFAAIEKRGAGLASAEAGGLPPRAFFYLLPSVPPLYLQILKQLSRWIDLRLYVLNPCREYWYDIVDRRRLHWLKASGRADHHEVGNALLAGWGKQTRAFVDLLLAEGGEEAVLDDDRFAAAGASGTDSMLTRLQDALLDLVELAPGSLAEVATDRSIEVHACHSLARQLEALRDQLLAIFDADDAPPASEVLVLLPDLDAAAPLIEAVFGSGGASNSRRIPWAITGRGPEATNAVADLLLRLLALPSTRLAADALFDLLQQPLLARRLRLDDAALLRIHDWLRQSGARWGLDGRHRAAAAGSGGSGDDRFSLRDGLRRLLLGHALPGEGPALDRTLCGDLLPTGDACGSEAGDLGSLWAGVEALATTLESLHRPRPAAAWPRLLNSLLADWIEAGDDLDAETIAELQAVRTAIERLAADFATAGLGADGDTSGDAGDSAVGVEVIRSALAGRLEGSAHGGVPTGAVTFSALSAFRGLTARVVCLLGLDDGVFPRQQRPAEFDLMPRAPKSGDRQSREDDRNLFLDLLLGCRQRLQLYYNGRSIRDNARLPPSVLVAELLDTLAAAIAPAGADAAALQTARQSLVLEHPLQPFSLALFDPAQPAWDARRPSYDAETCAAWQATLTAAAAPAPAAAVPVDGATATDDDDADTSADDDAPPEDLQPFFTAPLAPPGEEWRRVALPRLCAFYRHPARVLLRDRLRLRFDDEEAALPAEDPFELDWNSRRQLWSGLLPAVTDAASAAGTDAPGIAAAAQDLARAMRLAPAGAVGEVVLARELNRIAVLASEVAALRRSPPRPDHDFRFAATLADGSEDWQLHGRLGNLHADGQLVVREDDARGREFLDAWLRHLVLNACPPDDVAPVTTLIARNDRVRFLPVADADARLRELLGFYRQGLMAPLHFYPKAAWAYVDAGASLGKAQGIWASTRRGIAGEGDDAWWSLALRGVAKPLDADFEFLAGAIYGPMLAAIEDSATGSDAE